jgi:hypothetical protein
MPILHKLKTLFVVVIAIAVLMGVIGVNPVQAATFDFHWKGNAGYSAQGSFSYDETQNTSTVTEQNLDFLEISFFDPNHNLLKSYINIENGNDKGINPYLDFNFNPKTQALSSVFDVGEGNFTGENNFYLKGVVNSNLELRNLDTNVLDSDLGVLLVEKAQSYR